MNRGSRTRPLHRVREMLGFNEAPIHESGKCSHISQLNRTGKLLQ